MLTRIGHFVCCWQTANYTFFQVLAAGCCDQQPCVDLPVFKASVPEATAHKTAPSAAGPGASLMTKSSSGDVAVVGSPLLARKSSTGENSRDLSLAFSLGNLTAEETYYIVVYP